MRSPPKTSITENDFLKLKRNRTFSRKNVSSWVFDEIHSKYKVIHKEHTFITAIWYLLISKEQFLSNILRTIYVFISTNELYRCSHANYLLPFLLGTSARSWSLKWWCTRLGKKYGGALNFIIRLKKWIWGKSSSFHCNFFL